MNTQPGDPYPLGATWDGSGVNFALFSEHAEGVELCLFDDSGREGTKIPMSERTDHVWNVRVPGIGPGQRYGYRVHGPWDPEQGHRFNPAKLLLDPYARAIDGAIRWDDTVFGYAVGHPDGDLARDDRDSAPAMPKSVVVDPAFDWGDDRPLAHPWHETVIYETHVRGLTMRHPAMPEAQRGTYAGLAHPAVVDHLRGLGITAVELLPVHHFVADRHLVERGLTNYCPTDDGAVNALRARQQRNFLATLLLSQGVPMLLGGDELGRTQQGNNNAYCQDNELSWYDWDGADEALLEFTRRAIRLRREHPVFRRRRWFQGRPIHGSSVSDIGWFRPDGQEMSDDDWQTGFVKLLGMFLNGEGLTAPDREGNRVVDDSFLLLFNAHHEPLVFRLPDRDWGRRWTTVLDTRDEVPRAGDTPHAAGAELKVEARSVVVLRWTG